MFQDNNRHTNFNDPTRKTKRKHEFLTLKWFYMTLCEKKSPLENDTQHIMYAKA